MREQLNPTGELPIVRWCRTDNAPALHTCYDSAHDIVPWSHRSPERRSQDVLALVDLIDANGMRWTAAVTFVGPVRGINGSTMESEVAFQASTGLRVTGVRVVVE